MIRTWTWIFYFGYSVTVALAVQLWILPHVFPGWHAGNGLLVKGDWNGYHRDAVVLVEKIQEKGWSAWSLKAGVQNSIEVGIAAAVYKISWSIPWVLIPLQALLHSLGALLLTLLLYHFFPGRWWLSVIASLPFLLFPSNLVWVAMIHKDGASILASLLFLWMWVLLNKGQKTTMQRYRYTFLALLCLVLSWSITFCVRSYLRSLFLMLTYVFSSLLVLSALISVYRGKERWTRLGPLVLPLAIVTVLTQFIANRIPSYEQGAYPPPSVVMRAKSFSAAKTTLKKVSPPTIPIPVTAIPAVLGELKIVPPETAKPSEPPPPVWIETPGIPAWLEIRFFAITVIRNGFLGDKMATDLDPDIHFRSFVDELYYLPRALSLMYLAPLPQHWVGKASSEANSSLRRVVGAEMVFIYLLIPFIALSAFHFRKSLEYWICFVSCHSIMLLYTYCAPNAAALHRFRFVYLMFFVGMGLLTLNRIICSSREWWRSGEQLRSQPRPKANQVDVFSNSIST